MVVKPVRNSVRHMRGFVENTLSRERAGFLGHEKRRQHDTGENSDRLFHIYLPSLFQLDRLYATNIRGFC
jgi:hypothetical protein